MKALRNSTTCILLALTLLVALGCGGNGDTKAGSDGAVAGQSGADTGGAVGDVAPDFALLDLHGNTVTLSEKKGDVVLLDFWATWCGPCRMVMPHLEAIHKEFGDRGVTVLAVSTDRNATKVVPPFIEKAGYTFSVLYDANTVRDDFGGIRSLPTTFIIGPDGKVANKMIGAHGKADYLAEIKKLKPELF